MFNKDNPFHELLVVSRLLRRQESHIDAALFNMENRLMSAFGNLKNDVEKFIADVKAYQDSVATAIAKAVADDAAGADVDVTALQAEVDAADAALAPTQAAVVTSASAPAPVAETPAPAPVTDTSTS